MQKIIGIGAAIALLHCTPLHAQQDCKAIQDATARLACFDKPPAKPAAQPDNYLPRRVISLSDSELMRSIDHAALGFR